MRFQFNHKLRRMLRLFFGQPPDRWNVRAQLWLRITFHKALDLVVQGLHVIWKSLPAYLRESVMASLYLSFSDPTFMVG